MFKSKVIFSTVGDSGYGWTELNYVQTLFAYALTRRITVQTLNLEELTNTFQIYS